MTTDAEGTVSTAGEGPSGAERRSNHDVYRIGADLTYQETPCFCSADRTHSILDTRA